MIERSNLRKANLRTGLQAILLTGLAASVMSLFTLPTVSVSQTGADAGNGTETEEADEEDRYDFGGAEIVADQPAMNNYEGSPKKVDIQKIRESKDAVHFEVDFGGHTSRQKCGWFMFRVDDAGGKNVRIDLKHIGRYDNWKTLNPVFAQIPNLSDPKYFRSAAPEDGYKYVKARNGSKIPWTKGYQRWHCIRNVETKDASNTLVLRQTFTKDRVYVAMRPPYTLQYHLNFLNWVDRNGGSDVKVHDIGKTKNGNPLHIIQIGGVANPDESREKPCILMVNQEHGDEHDTSWLGEGLVRFLLGGSQNARALREKATFLVIPLMDPDGTIKSQYVNILHSFIFGKSTPTSRAYVRWLREWLNKGNRLDTVINVHNVESQEMNVHLANASIETKDKRYKELLRYHKDVVDFVDKQGYEVSRKPWKTAYRSTRLPGFLRRHAGTAHLFYETDSQMSDRHLTLFELRKLGVSLATAAVRHLHTEKAVPLLKSIRLKRKKRRVLLERYGILQGAWEQKRLIPKTMDKVSPVYMEFTMWQMPAYEKYLYLKNSMMTGESKILKKVYSQDGVSFKGIPDLDSIRLRVSNNK